MKTAWYEKTGPARAVLKFGDLTDPVPGPGEVLVAVRASGINPADVKRRAGWRGVGMDHPLIIPHTDGAGEIIAVGPGADAGRIGERVWLWNAQGGYRERGRAYGTAAELIAIDARQAVRLSDHLTFAEGACLGVPAMTAHRAVFADGGVDGKTVLVSGAAGAVGHFAVQLAALDGARVIGTVGNDASARHAKDAGAEITVNRRQEDVAARILDLTEGAGVDRIIEVDFAANAALAAAVLKPNGTIAAYSSSSNPEPVLSYYAFASIGANLRFIQGFAIPEDARRSGETRIDALAGSGRLHVAIGATFPLSDIALAHERVEAGGLGNVVVFPGDPA
ncbi:NADPH:quinone reductase [Martelella lutilitoris]|uniref:NADPH:quinone reductase n=1 Tax=Martelella lutilitoris TaxID=2583532 RepID=A0A5C4JVC4_9HYPH|nr:NADPH:quinone reductase [Martelella lutilitoris]TNB49091.1 NADPH:quinone reductase [Martelella lutilitoris]